MFISVLKPFPFYLATLPVIFRAAQFSVFSEKGCYYCTSSYRPSPYNPASLVSFFLFLPRQLTCRGGCPPSYLEVVQLHAALRRVVGHDRDLPRLQVEQCAVERVAAVQPHWFQVLILRLYQIL